MPLKKKKKKERKARKNQCGIGLELMISKIHTFPSSDTERIYKQ